LSIGASQPLAASGSIRSIRRPHATWEREYKDTTGPDVIKVLLRTTEKDGYWWVECAGCEGGWQVPFYAQERVG